jgi:hypothetical protein
MDGNGGNIYVAPIGVDNGFTPNQGDGQWFSQIHMERGNIVILIYADERLIFSNHLTGFELLDLSVTEGLNKSGTASFTMPPEHPAYNEMVAYKTEIKIFEDDVLTFRGRVLHKSDNFYKQRTVVCEGERGFFRDSVCRPYLYQTTPEEIFTALVGIHNAQVEPFKRFVVGSVTVTDPNDYVAFESETALKTGEVLDKLVERCGGYITFETDADGHRIVNWVADLGFRSGQSIEFGENLLDFTRADDTTEPATALIPYGAKNEETGERLTIAEVNNGVDFIEDAEAVAIRGHIFESAYWDDVTVAANLLTKAREHLASRKNIITKLSLSAVDLHYLDKNIATFRCGDKIRVKSKPHGVDEDFLLVDLSRNLLAPDQGQITLGKETASLTGLNADGEKNIQTQIVKTEQSVRAEFNTNIAAQIAEAKRAMTSLITQTSEQIKMEVAESYATNDEVTNLVSTTMTQLSDSFEFLFRSLETTVADNDESNRTKFEEINKYIRFENGNIILGQTGNTITLKIEHDRIAFLQSGTEKAFFSNNMLTVTDANFLTTLQIGGFIFMPRDNGNLSLIKKGGF